MDEVVIDVRDVCFAFSGQEVLHNVSFSVPARSLVAVVGPNGGGKTTLLRLLLGEIEPRYGTLRVFGGPCAAARPRIGYLPQSLPFDADFPVSVRDVVLLGRVDGRLVAPYGAADRRAAAAALARVGLSGFERRPFAELSGGERQRVLLAQALAGGPDLLLLDEPAASVDPLAANRLYALFRELLADLTILMVSHNLGVVTGHATHVLCVNRTAELHAAADVAAGTFREAFGGDLTVLLHDPTCHVLDSSGALAEPHSGAGQEGRAP
jgi:zinc transport system ATP-binding protein